VSDYWVSDQWPVGLLGVGPMGCRTIGLSDYREVPKKNVLPVEVKWPENS
jgi:hypothetical protein